MDSRLKKVYDINCNDIPSIDIDGRWLINVGFEVGTAYKIDYQTNYICISSIENNEFDSLLNSMNRQTDNISNIKLVRKVTRGKRGFPHIMLQGNFLGTLGFKIGMNILLQYNHGIIHIRALQI
jgi:hypothetical protein